MEKIPKQANLDGQAMDKKMHACLLSKFKYYVIEGKEAARFESYHFNRKLFV